MKQKEREKERLDCFVVFSKLQSTNLKQTHTHTQSESIYSIQLGFGDFPQTENYAHRKEST